MLKDYPLCDDVCWYAMRDLKRSNARLPAYRQLSEQRLEVFTPMSWKLCISRGRKERRLFPLMPDLLFVNSSRSVIDPIVSRTPTLQYRYASGGDYCEPIVVPDDDMSRFIRAVSASSNPKFYRPEELTAALCGRPVRIIGGPLDGYEGRLQTIRGSKTRRLMVEIPGILVAAVEVAPEFVEFL